jgi:hypothetical protein
MRRCYGRNNHVLLLLLLPPLLLLLLPLLLLLQVCELLLSQGADAGIEDAEGQLPQQVAPGSWTCWR